MNYTYWITARDASNSNIIWEGMLNASEVVRDGQKTGLSVEAPVPIAFQQALASVPKYIVDWERVWEDYPRRLPTGSEDANN